jgi:hypothetical protein
MTAALARMTRAARWSLGPASPHAPHRKADRLTRFSFATKPQSGHSRLVFFGSTTTTGTPASAAL